jgi:hypothetical protein
MILILILAVLSVATLTAMYLAIRGQHWDLKRIEDMEGITSPVDLTCFSAITDVRDRQFLRSVLPAKVFRRVQRERVRIAIGYVKIAARNAAILMRIGELHSTAASAEIRTRAKALVEESFRLRLVCLAALFMLNVAYVFPEQHISILDLISNYERMSDTFNLLGMSSDPVLASRARSWL